MDVNGAVAEGFEPVREAFARNFETLGDRGAAVAVYRDGRKVVDLWGGTKDVDGTDPWERGTAQIVRSATKGVVAAGLLLLHQRGELDLDAPVGAYWPEYKAAGKERTPRTASAGAPGGRAGAGPAADPRRGRRPRSGRGGGRGADARLGARARTTATTRRRTAG